ncbi:MAG: asparaginase, partial [Nocardiaceae bacterium]|nr:asparaginase [Nocardiaceae bacterium]
MAAPIELVTLGGTISMAVTEGGLATPQLDAAGIADLAGVHDVEFRTSPIAQLGGSELTFDHLRAVSRRLAELADVGGVIVVTGTDSIEEVAAWLTYTGPWPYPVAVTGSMLPGAEPGSDAAANLRGAIDAVRLGCWTEPVVVFAGKVLLGRRVQKVSGTLVDAFDTPGFPLLARRESHGWRVMERPAAATTLGPPGGHAVKVALVTAYMGADGHAIDCAAQASDAVVVAANGAGNLPVGMADAVIRLVRDGRLIVVGTR